MDELTEAIKRDIRLSKVESALFDRLAARPGGVVLRTELMAAIKGTSPRTINSHVMGIRRKMEWHRVRGRIETVRGLGFILRLEPIEKGSRP